MGLGLGKPGLPLPATLRWKLRDLPSSQATPVCICPALRPRPGHDHQAITVTRCCPRCSDDEGPSNIIVSRLNHAASALAVYASCRHCWRLRKTRFRPVASRYRVGLTTHRVAVKGFKLAPSPLPGLLGATDLLT